MVNQNLVQQARSLEVITIANVDYVEIAPVQRIRMNCSALVVQPVLSYSPPLETQADRMLYGFAPIDNIPWQRFIHSDERVIFEPAQRENYGQLRIGNDVFHVEAQPNKKLIMASRSFSPSSDFKVLDKEINVYIYKWLRDRS